MYKCINVECSIKKLHYLWYVINVCLLQGSGIQELIMNQHGNLWPLIGVHSQVLAEVLDTAERWLVQGESQKSRNFLVYPILPLRLLFDPTFM